MSEPSRRNASRPSNRLAFTLVELLVVISIMGVLVGLLLPAVQSARQAARRAECQNHVRQLGLAFQQHDAAHKFYPSGGWNWFDPPTYRGQSPAIGAEQRAGWGFQVLPYLEEGAVVDQGPVAAIAAAIPLFFCPARRPPQTITTRDNFQPPLTGGMMTRALCDYAASNREGTGLLQRYKPSRSRHITDGLSKTLLLGDKRMNLRLLGQPQRDDNEGYTVGWNADTLRRTDRIPRPDFFGAIDDDADKRFGSSHAASLNLVLADGSCHSLSYDIDEAIFQRLGERADGHAVDISEL